MCLLLTVRPKAIVSLSSHLPIMVVMADAGPGCRRHCRLASLRLPLVRAIAQLSLGATLFHQPSVVECRTMSRRSKETLWQYEAKLREEDRSVHCHQTVNVDDA